MRKEIIIAIIFGGVIGVIAGFGIWKANSSMKSNQNQEASGNQKTLESTDSG